MLPKEHFLSTLSKVAFLELPLFEVEFTKLVKLPHHNQD